MLFAYSTRRVSRYGKVTLKCLESGGRVSASANISVTIKKSRAHRRTVYVAEVLGDVPHVPEKFVQLVFRKRKHGLKTLLLMPVSP